jgi:hypothetical protein
MDNFGKVNPKIFGNFGTDYEYEVMKTKEGSANTFFLVCFL